MPISLFRPFSSPRLRVLPPIRASAALALLWLGAAGAAAGRDDGVGGLRLARGLSAESIAAARAAAADPRFLPGSPDAPDAQQAEAQANAQSNAFSWPQALQWAADNARNRSAAASADAARGLAQQSRASAWMPRADLNASTTRERTTTAGDSLRTTTSTVGATARMPLWNGAGRAGVRAQDASVRGTEWQARQVQIDVAKDTSSAYLGVVEASEQLRLLASQRALLNEQLRINEQRLKGGAGTVLDVLETRTRLEQARAEQTSRQAQLGSQALALRRLTGRAVPPMLAPLVAVQTADDALLAAQPMPGPEANGGMADAVPALSVALDRLRSRNPTLLFVQAQVDAAQATLDARRAEGRQPTVDAVGSVARNRVGSDATGRSVTQSATVGSVGLQLNLPLWTGGLQAGRDKEAFALLGKAVADRDDALNSIQTELRDTYQTLAQARNQVAVQQQVVRTAAATVEALRKAFVAGYRTNLDLLNAQQQVDVARQGWLSARVAVLTAQVGILALLDELDGDHITALAATAP
jgi:outer membrane protein TolC